MRSGLRLNRRNRLPLALAGVALLSLLWLWEMTLPLLDEQTHALQNRRADLQQRRQAAGAGIYQPLIARLQQPLPSADAVIAALHKTSDALDLADTAYTLSQPQPLDHAGVPLMLRRLSIDLPKADPATALALWQNLRQILPCEARLAGFSSDGPVARLEVELLGAQS